MKDYPLDLFTPVMFWPMEAAVRTPRRALKALLLLLYIPWFLLLLPITGILLVVSIVMSIWDEVNGRC